MSKSPSSTKARLKRIGTQKQERRQQQAIATKRRKQKFLVNKMGNPSVVVHKLSEKEIIELKGGVRETEPRTFAKHNLGRQPVTNDFPPRFSLGPMNVKCQYCGSLSFHNEKYSCCQNGKVLLQLWSEYPEELKQLMTGNSNAAKNFRKHIRKYNNLFAFASTRMRQAKDIPIDIIPLPSKITQKTPTKPYLS